MQNPDYISYTNGKYFYLMYVIVVNTLCTKSSFRTVNGLIMVTNDFMRDKNYQFIASVIN